MLDQIKQLIAQVCLDASVSVSDDAVSMSLFSELVSTAASGSTTCSSGMPSSVNADNRATKEHNI